MLSTFKLPFGPALHPRVVATDGSERGHKGPDSPLLGHLDVLGRWTCIHDCVLHQHSTISNVEGKFWIREPLTEEWKNCETRDIQKGPYSNKYMRKFGSYVCIFICICTYSDLI
jgi:hypothetical protein